MKPPVNPICCHHLEWIGWHLARAKREHTLPSLSLPSGSRRCSRRLAAGLSRLVSTASCWPWGLTANWSWWHCDRIAAAAVPVRAPRRRRTDRARRSAHRRCNRRGGEDCRGSTDREISPAKNRRLAAAAEGAKPALEVTVRAPALASSGGPRRLSLSDLRELGRRRRA